MEMIMSQRNEVCNARACAEKGCHGCIFDESCSEKRKENHRAEIARYAEIEERNSDPSVWKAWKRTRTIKHRNRSLNVSV